MIFFCFFTCVTCYHHISSSCFATTTTQHVHISRSTMSLSHTISSVASKDPFLGKGGIVFWSRICILAIHCFKIFHLFSGRYFCISIFLNIDHDMCCLDVVTLGKYFIIYLQHCILTISSFFKCIQLLSIQFCEKKNR